MRPNLTAADGFILGQGAKMFTIAGTVLSSMVFLPVWFFGCFIAFISFFR